MKNQDSHVDNRCSQRSVDYLGHQNVMRLHFKSIQTLQMMPFGFEIGGSFLNVGAFGQWVHDALVKGPSQITKTHLRGNIKPNNVEATLSLIMKLCWVIEWTELYHLKRPSG